MGFYLPIYHSATLQLVKMMTYMHSYIQHNVSFLLFFKLLRLLLYQEIQGTKRIVISSKLSLFENVFQTLFKEAQFENWNASPTSLFKLMIDSWFFATYLHHVKISHRETLNSWRDACKICWHKKSWRKID